MKAYEAALAQQSWQAVSPLIHEDAAVTFSDGGHFRGKEAVRQAFERNFAAIQDEQYAISDLYWVIKSAGFAVCTYSFRWSGLLKGQPAGGTGHGTSVMVNEDGRWLLLAEHLGP